MKRLGVGQRSKRFRKLGVNRNSRKHSKTEKKLSKKSKKKAKSKKRKSTKYSSILYS